ncbi:MAG: cobalt-zinc-cadmium efflux system outer membrane protein [Pseudohongiellaceae bacterium]
MNRLHHLLIRPLWLAVAALSVAPGCSTPHSGYDRGIDAWDAVVEELPEGLPQALGDSSTLSDQLIWARFYNPAVRAAAHRWRSALEQVPQSSGLPDPRLTFGYFIDEVETRTGPMDWRLGVSQRFPWFGSLDLAGQVAVDMAEVARERWLAARQAVSLEVRTGWYELAYLDAAIDVTRGHRDLMISWESVARTRYATALGSDADVIRAQVELGKLDDRLRSLEDLKRPLSARLNGALNRPAGAPLPTTTLEHGGVDAARLEILGLAESLDHSSPELRARSWAIEAAEQQLRLADKQFYPDFSLGLDYTNVGSARGPGVSGSGDDVLAITTGISLPLRRGQLNSAKRQAQAQKAAAQADWRAAHNRMSAELELGLYSVRDAERRITLYLNTLVPKGQQSISSTTVAYQAGDASFLDLIDAERVLLEFQLATARARADHAQALATVEQLTGRDLGLED